MIKTGDLCTRVCLALGVIRKSPNRPGFTKDELYKIAFQVFTLTDRIKVLKHVALDAVKHAPAPERDKMLTAIANVEIQDAAKKEKETMQAM